MKLKKLILFAVISLVLPMGANAQINGRLPRKTIIGAMQNAMQDSTASTLKPFVCKKGTKSITIEVSNTSLPQERPYTITADSLGVTLEIFRGNEHVFNEFFHYHGCNFAKILAKANTAKLKKVKAHGEAIDGGMTTVLNFNNAKGSYFALTDNSGVMDYEGDFDGIITEITRQIPNFQAIVCKDYDQAPSQVVVDGLQINGAPSIFSDLTEIANVLSPASDAKILDVNISSEENTLIVKFPADSTYDLALIKMRKFKGKKKKNEFYGISYEDIVKNIIQPTKTENADGIVTNTYAIIESNSGMYVLYDKKTNKAIVVKVTFESTVG